MRFRLDPTAKLLLKRGLRRGFLTLRRERGWGMSLVGLLGVILLLQMTFLVSLGVQGIDRLLRARTDIRLQLQEGSSDAEIQQFLVAARGLPYIETVEYLTREKAYDRERTANPDLIAFLEQFKIENPFPDTVGITLGSLSSYDAFVEFAKEPQWRSVVDPAFLSQSTDQEREIRHMLRLTDAGRSLAAAFLLVTAGILLFTVIELVRRRAFLRQEEVFVERMSGAQEASVIVPFATEASVLLLISLLLSLLCITFFLYEIPRIIPALESGGTFDALRTEIGGLLTSRGPWFLLFELLCVPVIGFLGAYLGTRGQKMTLASV